MVEAFELLLTFISAVTLLELGWIIKIHGCVKKLEGFVHGKHYKSTVTED